MVSSATPTPVPVSRQRPSLRPIVASRRVLRGLATPAKGSLFQPLDTFSDRHIGPNASEVQEMLEKIGYESMDAFVGASVPPSIRIPEAAISNAAIPSLTESELFSKAKALAAANKPFKSYIGMGYHNAVVPPVILRNVRIWRSSLGPCCNFQIDHGKPCMVYAIYPLPAGDCARYI